jgi:hypothetical protein
LTAQGHPRRIFQTAIERGNLVLAEATARELGRITLDESLALTALVARHEPARRSRFAVRWLERLLEEDERLSIEEVALAASALATMGGRGHAEALSTLSAMAEKATRNARARRVAS